MSATRPSAEVALEMLARGIFPIPLRPRSKVPIDNEWQKLRVGAGEVPKRFTNGENLGGLLGEPSGWLADVDVDSLEALRAAPFYLPRTGAVFGRPSKPRSHHEYRSPGAVTAKFQDPRKRGDGAHDAMLVELRSTGGQTVFPGSIHEGGEAIVWEPGGESAPLPEVPADELRAAVARVAAAALLGRYWPDGVRHDAALALAGGLLRSGWVVEEVGRFVDAVAVAAEDPERRDRARAVSDTARDLQAGNPVTGWPTLAEMVGADIVAPIRTWLGIRGEARGDRPEIIVREEYAPIVEEALVALAADADLFHRAGSLVRIVRDSGERRNGVRREAGSPVIAAVEVAHLRERMDRCARWVRLVKDRKTGKAKKVSALPPPWAAEAIAVRRDWPLPHLEGVTETPMLRPDGTILEVPGYDAATGMLFDPQGVVFPHVPDRPTVKDAANAALELLDPFTDFPLKSEADRSAVLAEILTLVGRPAIDGPCPAFSNGGNIRGVGKGLLTDAICIIGTGRVPAGTTAPRDDEEMRKRILALALEGDLAILVDNIEGAFGSPSLASVLTRRTFTDRLLGFNRTATVALRGVWFVTGNNLTFKGDLGRRVVPCDLETLDEHPEDRDGFRYPELLDHVRQERSRLVVAALTILRAYHLAGRPAHGKPAKGSFEAWDRLIRGAVVWVSGVDPLAGCERIREDGDADLDALRSGLAAWTEHLGPEPLTAAEAVERARAPGAPAGLLAGLAAMAGCDAAKLDSRRLGVALRTAKRRPCDGRRFEHEGTGKRGFRWTVRGEGGT